MFLFGKKMAIDELPRYMYNVSKPSDSDGEREEDEKTKRLIPER